MVKVTIIAPNDWVNPYIWAWNNDRILYKTYPGKPLGEPVGYWNESNNLYEVEIPNWVTSIQINANNSSITTCDIDVELTGDIFICINSRSDITVQTYEQWFENGNDTLSDYYDLYLSLQPFEADSPALMLGFKTEASTTIVDEENDVKDVTIKFTGEEENYKISYKVGFVTYPCADYEDGADLTPGVKFSLLVNSSNRTSVNDVSGANVTLINESDMTLYIKVINEDEGTPRFNVVAKKGDIVIFQ